ncbi:hypothetical protein [Chryseobacterium arthrosphaerae]|uniref:hypothetical protein n=1 Tax=Chryseobacterium arthrosphaerae TaxID=651561 RepID=UPI0028B17D89|nr:hypothetical protein [Chryseobacterium arthrosphaerae]
MYRISEVIVAVADRGVRCTMEMAIDTGRPGVPAATDRIAFPKVPATEAKTFILLFKAVSDKGHLMPAGRSQ